MGKAKVARKGKFIVICETWNVEVLVLIGYNSKEVNRVLMKVMGSAPDDLHEIDKSGATGRTYWKTSSTFVVWLKSWPKTAFHYGVLQHELFHVVDNALRGKGIKLSDESDEAYAYMMESLTRMTYAKLWK